MNLIKHIEEKPQTAPSKECPYCGSNDETRAISPYGGCRFCRSKGSLGELPSIMSENEKRLANLCGANFKLKEQV